VSEGTIETQQRRRNRNATRYQFQQVKQHFLLETPSDIGLKWLIAMNGIVAKNGAPIRVALPLHKTGNGSPTKKGGIPRV
jgi:hypothetical protein